MKTELRGKEGGGEGGGAHITFGMRRHLFYAPATLFVEQFIKVANNTHSGKRTYKTPKGGQH